MLDKMEKIPKNRCVDVTDLNSTLSERKQRCRYYELNNRYVSAFFYRFFQRNIENLGRYLGRLSIYYFLLQLRCTGSPRN